MKTESPQTAPEALPPRMGPIAPERMTDAQKAAVAEMTAGERGSLTGSYVPIMRSPGLMHPLQKVGEYFRFQCGLEPRLKEMAALMAARLWTQQYVWEAHTRAALKCGLSIAIMEAIAEGRRPEVMSEDEHIVYDFFTELFANKSVSDATYSRAAAQLGEKVLIDIIGLAAYYASMAMILNVARTPPAGVSQVPRKRLPQ